MTQVLFYTALSSDGIPLPAYSRHTEHAVLDAVLSGARREGFKGTAAERMKELNWTVGPVFAALAATPQAQPAQGAKYPRPPEWIRGQLRAIFPVTLFGNPMREFSQGEWEVAEWPSEAPKAQAVQRDADMFWDSQDGERFGHDINSIIEECDDGAVVKIVRAQSLPIITVRVIQTDDGCDYEVLDDAAIAASAAQKGGVD